MAETPQDNGTGDAPEAAESRAIAQRSPQTETGLSDYVPQGGSPALAIMLNEQLFNQAKQIATYISRAEGFTPRHLIGKAEACFAVVTRSLTWKLDPFAVASCTYQTPGGNIGYEGKLCQAILENSGQLEGGVRFEHYGDWSKVQGKFEIKVSKKGNEYPAATWTNEDAEGLGVTVRAKVKGEDQPREWSFDLVQAYPRNSTLWALDPKTQICYTAVRRFANVAAPGLFMGVPFDRDDWSDEPRGPSNARDITPPRPTRATVGKVSDKQDNYDEPLYTLIDEVGEVIGEDMTPAEFSAGFVKQWHEIKDAKTHGQYIENNDDELSRLGASKHAEGCYEPIAALFEDTTGGDQSVSTQDDERVGTESQAEEAKAADGAGATPAAPDQNTAASSKGKAPDFDSGNGGSSPPAASTDYAKWKAGDWSKWKKATLADIESFDDEAALREWFTDEINAACKANMDASRNEGAAVLNAFNERLGDLQREPAEA